MKKARFLICVLAVAAISGVCCADTITDTLVTSSKGDWGGVAGFTFTATLTTNPDHTFSLDFLVQNTSQLGGTLSAFTLSLLGGGNASIDVDPTKSTLNGWNETDNATFGNGNNSSGCSTSSGSGGWLCASGSSVNIGPGKSLDFVFNGTYQGSVSDPFDLKALGSIGETKLAVSTYMSSSRVPEPSSMLLLASGLSGIAMIGRFGKYKRR